MKKISLFIIGVLFLFPITVFAADPQVTSVNATASGKTISYTGTTEEGLTAVMCKLYSGNDELKKLSSEVDNKAFSGSFEVTDNGDYTVSCARYEGGTIVSADVTVEETSNSNSNQVSNTTESNSNSNVASNSTSKSNSNNNDKVSNPVTGDNIKLFIILFVIATLGIVSGLIIKKKNKA